MMSRSVCSVSSQWESDEMFLYVCPTCEREVTVERREDLPTRPFCSRRCKLIDLGKWFDEEYVISDPIPIDPDEPPPVG